MLLAASSAWSLDVAFFAVILLGLILGVTVGFVRGIMKIAGTVFSVVVAFFFCTQVCALLEDWFSLTTALSNALHSATLAYWLGVVISFLVLSILVKVGAFLIGRVGQALVNRSKVFAGVDRCLGGLLGVAEALLLLFAVMLVFKWIAIDVVDAYIAQSSVVGKIYFGEWFEWISLYPAQFFGV